MIVLKAALITVLILGNSQTAGKMGHLLQQHYSDHGVQVYREAASGKGVGYFLNATRSSSASHSAFNDFSLSDNDDGLYEIMFHNQQSRIRKRLEKGVDYIIVASLGGNDAYRGCCNTPARRFKMKKRYRRLFKQLCAHGAIVIFNGSPPADIKKWPRFDKRRELLDKIQSSAAIGTCVIRNSMRHMKIKADPDGYHYNKNAEIYLQYMLLLPGMTLPILEAGQ